MQFLGNFCQGIATYSNSVATRDAGAFSIA